MTTPTDLCPECGATIDDHDPNQHERERLADSIAHDLVSPPPDDASEAVVASRMRYVTAAYAAAYDALAHGGSEEEACWAADRALHVLDVEGLP